MTETQHVAVRNGLLLLFIFPFFFGGGVGWGGVGTPAKLLTFRCSYF
jgi:hypothetical protein